MKKDKVFKTLESKSKSRGFLTENDIDEVINKVELTADEIDELYSKLAEADIKFESGAEENETEPCAELIKKATSPTMMPSNSI